MDGSSRRSDRPLSGRSRATSGSAAAGLIIRRDAIGMKRQLASIGIDLPPMDDTQASDIVAFLKAPTGVTATSRPMGAPETVPSGL